MTASEAPTSGQWSRGLADRVEALGGGLMVDSPDGSGTCLRAEVQLAREVRAAAP
jgi:signal transduction histidine kinase